MVNAHLKSRDLTSLYARTYVPVPYIYLSISKYKSGRARHLLRYTSWKDKYIFNWSVEKMGTGVLVILLDLLFLMTGEYFMNYGICNVKGAC